MNYLILLNSYPEAKKWMQFKKDSPEVKRMSSGDAHVILTKFGMSTVQSAKDIQLPKKDEDWIIVAYVKKPENGKENLQKKLKEKIDDKSYRIFHHGGSLNAGQTTIKDVQVKFKEAGFVEAGFLDKKLMYFSEKGGFPWDMEKVKNIFSNEETDNDRSENALEHLKSAWDKAWAYFNIDKPIEKVLEGLFPLYVDAINLTPSTDQADWNAALTAAWSNLNRLLNELGPLDANQLLITWKEVVAQVDNKAKPLIHAVIGLLNHCITALEVTQAARTSIRDEKRERFIAMFKFLSDAYYSKHPEFSVPPK